ncbi:DUF58 domain-containing protein [Thermoleophilia bacterium SCSIO 60948]|nr:DUF58 domain-containing protein [Thermoleophilia bacterium SCSIO 60948]
MRRAAGFALAGAGLWIVGSGLGEPSLLALGVALVLYPLLASGWLMLATRGARLERSGLPARIAEGESFGYEIELRGGSLRAPGGLLSDPASDLVTSTAPGWRSLPADAALEGRGRRELEAPVLELTDPLGIASRCVTGERSEILVMPRIETVEASATGAEAGLAAALSAAAAAGGSLEARGLEFEVDGLRPYRPGVSASRIHWPTVARTGEMVERRLAAGEGAAALVVADASAPEGREALDAMVRAAASLVHALAPRGGCGLVLSGLNRTLRVGERHEGFDDAHVRLALLEPGPMPALARDAAPRVVFWVAARPLHRSPVGGLPTVLVTPFAEPREGGFTVAGCTGVPLERGARHRALAGSAR